MKTEIPKGMPKGFWLDFLASETALRVLSSQQYDKKLTPEEVLDTYELSPKDKKLVLKESKERIRKRMKWVV
jgi:hypothetical protein